VQLRSCIEDAAPTIFYHHATCKPINSLTLLYKLSAHLRLVGFYGAREVSGEPSVRELARRSVRYHYDAVCVAGHVAATLVILMGVQA
jgi:hypothetical protein